MLLQSIATLTLAVVLACALPALYRLVVALEAGLDVLEATSTAAATHPLVPPLYEVPAPMPVPSPLPPEIAQRVERNEQLRLDRAEQAAKQYAAVGSTID